ncbi:MAG: hypothetical protein BMS9Abin36_0436 [Gammaproteobacteria bacterium]|nr:MAG: hypothetical protein BMS9Abin36_0436 [Gammaproteobacteria bacterium]
MWQHNDLLARGLHETRGHLMDKRRVLDGIRKVPKTIERGSVYMGDIQGRDNYLVHGEVYGDCNIQGVLMLTVDCFWKGDIEADVVIVNGSVEGNIVAHTKIELRETADIRGKMRAPIVAIEHGARVRGEVHEESYITHFEERRSH